MEASPALSRIGLALYIAEKGFPIFVYNPRDFVLSIAEANGRGRRTRRKKDAENTERMHRCRTSAIRHTALRLSGWQSPPGLSLGHGLSLELAYAGAPSPGRRALSPRLSPEQPTTLELL